MKNKKKYLSFDDLRISYDPRDNVVRLSSGDAVLRKEKFRLMLKRNTPLDDSLRKMLAKEGIIKPRPSLDLPEYVSIQDAQETPWNVIPLGQTYSRKQVNWDTSLEPHALLVGRPGGGRNVIQTTVLHHISKNIQHWDVYGIDLQKVGLTPYQENPKLQENLHVATDVASSFQMLQKVEKIRQSRYELLKREDKNRITPLIHDGSKKAIMVMIDGAFLLLSPTQNQQENAVKKQMQEIIFDLSRLGPTAGIYLMISTQRPDATVITRELKANLDVRIAAGRLGSTESALVLGSGVASQLPGHVKGRAVIRSRDELEDFQAFYTSIEDFPA